MKCGNGLSLGAQSRLMILNISQSCVWKFLIIDTSMDSGYKKPAGTSGTDLEYWASRLLADTTDYTWWNLYTKDYTDKTITAFGFRDIGRGRSNAGQPEARIYGRQERGPSSDAAASPAVERSPAPDSNVAV